MIFQCYLSLYFKGLNGSQMMHKAQAGLGCKGTIHPKRKAQGQVSKQLQYSLLEGTQQVLSKPLQTGSLSFSSS